MRMFEFSVFLKDLLRSASVSRSIIASIYIWKSVSNGHE